MPVTVAGRLPTIIPVRALFVVLCCLLAAACRSSLPAPTPAVTTPIRFILTFDDGPSALETHNPTQSVLDQLKNNPLQPKLKAVFFVQTRAHNAGGTPLGRQLLRREHAEGHLLGFHTSSPLGHVGHLRMSDAELQSSLRDGIADLVAITGSMPVWLRPPYFTYSDSTADAYRDAGFRLILSDLSANDGILHFSSPRRRWHFANRLLELHHRLAQTPHLPNPIPVVVTFHDVNRATAAALQDYLQLLVEEARWAGLTVADKPYYDDTAELEAALTVWWRHNENLRRTCWGQTCPAIGNYQPNRSSGKMTQQLERPPG